MVTLDKLREDMKTLRQVDKNLHFVEVNADTIDEALAERLGALKNSKSRKNKFAKFPFLLLQIFAVVL